MQPIVAQSINRSPRFIPYIEAQLIDEAYAIDRELNRAAFRQMGVYIEELNEAIKRNNKYHSSPLTQVVLRQVEQVRRVMPPL